MLVKINNAPKIVLTEDYVLKASVSANSPFQDHFVMNYFVN